MKALVGSNPTPSAAADIRRGRLVWLRALAWKAGKAQKAFVGSNPTLSAATTRYDGRAQSSFAGFDEADDVRPC